MRYLALPALRQGEGFVDLAHWQVLGLGRHIMAGGELEHSAHVDG